MTGAPTICFSFDIDWAPEFMIDELHALLVEHSLPATVFCTHDSAATRRLLELEQVEAGLHPNFLVADENARVLSEIKALYPSARVARNHALYYHSRLLPLLHRAEIRTLSNTLLFLERALEPHYDWSGLVRLPIYWEDDVHSVYFDGEFGGSHGVDVLHLDRVELKVLDFHPVHLYLNTGDLEHYQRAKTDLRDESRAKTMRRSGAGARTFFEQAVAATADLPRARIGDVAAEFRARHDYTGAFARTLDER